MNATSPPELLLERYKLAYSEYRAEVALGTERQKLFISLNPAIAVLSASLKLDPAWPALLLASAASLAGIFLVDRSHTRYQQTRNVLLALAKQLGTEEDWQTTGGMREQRGEPRWNDEIRVTSVIKWLLASYALFDLVAAVHLSNP